MHSQFLTSVLIALCVARGVLSIPLELTPLAPASNAEEQANEARLNAAKTLANKNILKMEHVLNNPTLPGHQAMIDASFGTDESLNINHVKNTVQTLKNGPAVPVSLETEPTPGVIAYTQYTGNKTPLSPSHVEFGNQYHSDDTSGNARAATLIHEATHFQSDTGDNIVKGTLLPGSDKKGSRTKMYTSNMEPATHPNQLANNDATGDPKWAKLRDDTKNYWDETVPGTKNLHKAAESYAQFSSMCGAAVSDAAVGLRRRAMADGNWDEAAAHLLRRQACSLPKDHFAKKAAAKKAAEAKTAKTTVSTKEKTSRVASAKFGKNVKANVGKSPLSRSKTSPTSKLTGKKALASNKQSRLLGTKSGVKAKTIARPKTLPKSKAGLVKSLAKSAKSGKTVAGSRAKSQKSRLSSPTKSRTVKPLAKKAKALTGSRSKVAPKSKVGGAKSLKALSKSRVTKPANKGAIRPKTSVSKRPAATKKTPSTLKKNLARPTTKKNVARPAAKKNVASTNAKKNIARPSPKKVARPASNVKKNIARPGAKKNVARPSAKKNVARPASKKVARPASNLKNIARPAAKKNVVRPSAKKNVARPTINKKVARPVANAKKNVARPAAKKSVTRLATNAKKNVALPKAKNNAARPAAKKNVARPSAKQNVARPAAKKTVARPAPMKNVARPAAPKKNVARPAAKVAPRPPASAQRQNKPKAAALNPVSKAVTKPAPKPAPKAAPKAAPKKGRRDLEFQL